MAVRIASNHWDLAVETHNTNHPDADHLCADLSAVDPRRFPRTDLLWASPECTNHSVAGPQARRRATGSVRRGSARRGGRTVPRHHVGRPRFAEAHRYQAVIVENVVDAWHWEPFRAWLMAMDSLGYDHHVVFLNSMHAQAFGPGAPQSRDRMYVVFWRKGNQRPEIERVTAPAAVCRCTATSAPPGLQTRGAVTVGRYRQQYIYTCPTLGCHQIVEPHYRPAAEIIDWALLGQRIGDRDRPLAEKTLARIRAGIERYWAPLLVPVEGRDGKQAAPVDQPARTTRENDGIAMTPFIAELRGGGSKHRPSPTRSARSSRTATTTASSPPTTATAEHARRATRWPPSPRSSAMRF
ncbi:C-5 cytosine-specific DNA methylase family protein [Mycobacterium xenopi 3993]|nr:C-5 cytosine-specific DNA methylase family protein [Mycobacterium xenopi 3993]